MLDSPSRPPARERRDVLLAVLALTLAALTVYANSFNGPFVFDDRPAILANPTLNHFTTALSPPRDGGTIAGRPLVNLSLALNRTISGTTVWSYHALNVAIHIAGALTLFGLIRRARVGPNSQFSTLAPTALAFSAALLWTVHPLQTAAVSYTVQRAESLMALSLLLTLYCFARGASRSDARWLAASVVACLTGMACKEVMAVAPLVVLLYDRTFITGSFVAALRTRVRYYTALAATWLLLAWLVFTNAARSGTAGFGGRTRVFDYAVTQCTAIISYLRLALWPRPLVFDYGTPVAHLADVWPQALLVFALLATIIVALRQTSVLGFLGAAFFLMLAPSSSIIPIHTQTIAEHRMYLPLAVVAITATLAIERAFRARTLGLVCVLAVPLATATHLRNRTYASAIALWSDTVAKVPDNPRAHNHLGVALVQAGRAAEAIPHFETALRLAADDAEAHNNLANALAATGRASEALTHFEAAARLRPDSAATQLNLANALLRADRPADAVPHFLVADRLAPAALDAAARYNYGVALARTRQLEPAIEQFRATLALDAQHVGARVNLANALLLTGRAADAIGEYEAALRQRPDDPQIRANLNLARAQRK